MLTENFKENSKTREEVISHFEESTFSSLSPAMLGRKRTIIAANPAYARAMGAASVDDLIGLSTTTFYADTQPTGINSEAHRETIREKILEFGFHRFTVFLKSLDDKPFLTEVSSRVIHHQTDYLVLHTFRPIHEPSDVEIKDRTNDEVFREIVNKSSEKTALLIDGHFAAASKSMLRFFGYKSVNDMSSYTAGSFSPEYQPDGRLSSVAVVDVLKSAIEQGDCRTPWVVRDANHQDVSLDIHLTALNLSGQQSFQITFHDYTNESLEKRAAERMLAAFDATSDALMLVDPAKGRIIDCNRVAHEMLGYSKSEMLEVFVPNLVPDDYKERNKNHLEKLISGEVVPVFNSIHLAKNGERVPINIAVQTIDIEGQRLALASVRDLREELKLRNSADDIREQFETVGKLLPVGVFIETLEEGNVYVNEAWTRITGISKEDARGDGWQQMLPEENRAQMIADTKRALKEEGCYSGRFQLSRPDGETVWIEHKSVKLKLRDGTTPILGIVLDVTEAEQRQRELEEAKRVAEDASEAKSVFLSRMSHELRTPLNAVLGFTQVLQLDDLTEAQLDSLGHIEQGGIHLLRQIEDLLNLSRIEQGRLNLVLLDHEAATLVERVVNLVQKIADIEGVEMVLREMDKSVTILVDEHRFTQVILNLLSNAIKYNRKGGKIEISVSRLEKQARIEIVDTGNGIPADKLKHLFIPFERLGAEKSQIDGLGIGLALAKELMNHMSGTINAKSEEGVGTTMTVLLPLA